MNKADFIISSASTGALFVSSCLSVYFNAMNQNWVVAGVHLLGVFVTFKLWRSIKQTNSSLRFWVALLFFSFALAIASFHTGNPDQTVLVPAIAAGVPILISFLLKPSHASAAFATSVHALSFLSALLLSVSSNSTQTSSNSTLFVILTAILSIFGVLLIGSVSNTSYLPCIILSIGSFIAQIPIRGAPASMLLDTLPYLLLCSSALSRSQIIHTQPKESDKKDQ